LPAVIAFAILQQPASKQCGERLPRWRRPLEARTAAAQGNNFLIMQSKYSDGPAIGSRSGSMANFIRKFYPQIVKLFIVDQRLIFSVVPLFCSTCLHSERVDWASDNLQFGHLNQKLLA
jgi:hypothetical protein